MFKPQNRNHFAGFSTDYLRELSRDRETPFYAYNSLSLHDSFQNLQQALTSRCEILYSVKANPHHEVLACLRGAGALVDVASMGELRQVRAAGFAPEQISFGGPGKTAEELAELAAEPVLSVVVESQHEVELLGKQSQTLGKPVSICLRVNPTRYFFKSGREMKNQPNQFGIDEETLLEVATVARAYRHLKVVGLHFFVGSHYLDATLLLSNFENFLGVAANFQRQLDVPLEIVNLGGGFGVPHFHAEEALDLAALHEGMQRLLRSESARALGHTRLFAESGRFLVGNSGVMITRVLDLKESFGTIFAVCDAGIHQFLSLLNWKALQKSNLPVCVIKTQDAPAKTSVQTVTLVGPTNYSEDIIALNVSLPALEVGDLICVGLAGAYGLSFSPYRFMGLKPPAEIFL